MSDGNFIFEMYGNRVTRWARDTVNERDETAPTTPQPKTLKQDSVTLNLYPRSFADIDIYKAGRSDRSDVQLVAGVGAVRANFPIPCGIN